MLGRSSLFFPIVLALLLAIITFWINLTVEQQGPKIDGSDRHDPDYIMNNFVNTQTDTTGKLHYVLAAAEMVHYPDDDSTVLQRPRFTQYATDINTLDKPYTRIEGLRGYVSSNGEQVTLVDNVKVTRQAFDGKGEMQITTEKLDIFPDQDTAKTDAPVVITQAPKTLIHATGMIFDKKHKTVKLLKRVKVHYERPTGVATKTKKTKKNSLNASPSAKSGLSLIPNMKPQDNKQQYSVSPTAKLVGTNEPSTNKQALKKSTKLSSKQSLSTQSPSKKRQTIKLKSRSNK
jgi:lipopolysaccharide export system protein LptC